MRQKNIFDTIVHWRDFRLQIFIEGTVVGLIAGVIVVLFRFLLEKSDTLRENIYVYIEKQGAVAIIIWFLVLIFIAYLLGIIMKKEPLAGGSGIPQVKGEIARQIKMKWPNIIIAKFVGGVLAIGAGLSLGREGPSIQLGAAVGQGVSRILGRMRIEEKYLITSGASAGLAAAFNAPLAGVIFALEELHKNFSPAVLMAAMSASLTADLVTQQFFGQKPIFNFSQLKVLPLSYYVYLIGLGLFCGVFGVLFNRVIIKFLNIYERQTIVPKSMVAVFPLLIAGVLGFFLPEVLGGGNQLIDQVGSGQFAFTMLIILVVGKFLFTMISYCSGVPGGIFLPMLVIGALSGGVYGHLVVQYIHINSAYFNNFVVLAMAAYFTAITKAPVTGSILITEMTGSFHHLLSLIIVSMVAYLVSDLFKSKPIYEELLDRSLAKQKGSKTSLNDDGKNKMVLEVVVSIGCSLEGKRVKDISWPQQSLLVSIKRGEKEITPYGDTKIIAGDYLFVMVNENQVSQMKQLYD